MRGTQIIVTTEPRADGFIEGIVSGTPLPGSVVQMTTAAITAGQGRFTWTQYTGRTGTDGMRSLLAVLDADWDQGQTAATAYVTGTRCFIYVPIPGEEMNMLVNDTTGTANAHTVGDYFILDHSTGRLKNSTGPTLGLWEPFQGLETVVSPLTAFLLWCRCIANS